VSLAGVCVRMYDCRMDGRMDGWERLAGRTSEGQGKLVVHQERAGERVSAVLCCAVSWSG